MLDINSLSRYGYSTPRMIPTTIVIEEEDGVFIYTANEVNGRCANTSRATAPPA